MIENPEKRIINFMFVNPFPVKINEFALRLRKIFDNKLDAYISETDNRINAYIEKIRNDELDDEEAEPVPYPISFSETPHLTFDISSIGRIGLTTADDPFFKLLPAHKKYFPEIYVYDKEGEIIEVIDEDKTGVETQTKGQFETDCRDIKLKINDDRKASISLMLQENVQMVVLAIKTRSLIDQTDIKEGEFDRAQFRFIDDETNQTLDQRVIKDIKATLPTPSEGEGDDEEQQEPEPEPEDEEEEEGAPKKEKPQNVIIVGRIFLDGSKWIYEQYHYMFREDKHTDFFTQLGQIEKTSRSYLKDKEAQIKEEEKTLHESKEAAAQAAAAKAASKKSKKNKKSEDKNKKNDPEEDKTPEEEEVNEPEVETDYMPGFKNANEGIYSTVFGPLTFELKDNVYDQKKAQDAIMKKMKDTLGDQIKNCTHGFKFCMPHPTENISRKRMLKASRNVQNCTVQPIVPSEKPVEAAPVEGEGEGEGDKEAEE
jgi:hypothetical protein